MDTSLSIYEIENLIAKSKDYNYIKNIVAYNVIGESENLRIGHECDVLVCSKAGYLTEIEIKRSWADFLADFAKDHDHSSELIKNLYYCVPLCLKDKVIEFLRNVPEDRKNDFRYSAGVITYSEDGVLTTWCVARPNWIAKKLFIEQRFEMARLEAMRVVKLKDRIVKMEKSRVV